MANGEPERASSGYLTRRETELLFESGAVASAERLADHRREHDDEANALDKALAAEKALRDAHDVAHDAAHESHEEKHVAEGEAVKTALVAVAKERSIHAEAHERDHVGHQREHTLANLAIDKAEAATDKRFSGANAYREQISDMVRNLASRESVDVFVKEVDRRFEDMRVSIRALETTDVKAEGKGLGQSAVIAYIVAGVSIIGSLVVLSNLLVGTP